jgi:hypothetical protein
MSVNISTAVRASDKSLVDKRRIRNFLQEAHSNCPKASLLAPRPPSPDGVRYLLHHLRVRRDVLSRQPLKSRKHSATITKPKPDRIRILDAIIKEGQVILSVL